MDFDLLATNRSNTHTLWESLRNKGWYDLRRITPDYNGNYALRSTLNALRSMVHGHRQSGRDPEGNLDGSRSSLDAFTPRRQHDLAVQRRWYRGLAKVRWLEGFEVSLCRPDD